VIIGANVDDAVGDSWCGVDSVSGGTHPKRLAGGLPTASRGVESIEQAVKRANIDHAIGNSGCRANPCTCGSSPQLLSCGGIVGIQVLVIGAEIDDAIGDRRRGTATGI